MKRRTALRILTLAPLTPDELPLVPRDPPVILIDDFGFMHHPNVLLKRAPEPVLILTEDSIRKRRFKMRA